MKVDCPYCQSSAVCESTDDIADQLIEQISNPAVVDRAVSKLCQSMGLHPLLKVVLSVTLVIAIEHITFNQRALPLAQTPYRCEDCQQLFMVFTPFI